MTVKLLTEHHLEFLSLKGACTGSSEYTLVKMPHCLKSQVAAHLAKSPMTSLLEPRTSGIMTMQGIFDKFRIRLLQTRTQQYCMLLGPCYKLIFTLQSGPEVIKLFPCSTQLSTKFILLINVKIPTIVGILSFISMINTTSERLKARNFFNCRYFNFYEQLKFRAQLS